MDSIHGYMYLYILRNVQDLKRIKSNKSMFLLNTNVSIASFNTTTIKLVFLDPYNNTFGEEDWFVVFCTAILCIFSIVLICAMLGIVMFVKYGIEDKEHPKLLGTIHLRHWQNFTIFDPFLTPNAVFYNYQSANLANF